MAVYIIGAGPGDPKLLTLRAAELIARCPLVLYTGSLVPRETIALASAEATVRDSSGMTLDEIVALIAEFHARGQDVARVHTGDPSIFGSTAEQMRRLKALNIPCEIIPGVSSFTAAAAALGKELTLPELSQTIILSRAEGRTPMPELEKLDSLATHRATLCLFLSINLLKRVVRELIPSYGEACPIAVVHKASCPDQQIVTGTLADIVERVQEAKITSQSMLIVGEVLTAEDFADSRLYDPTFTHRFRRGDKTAQPGVRKGAASPASGEPQP